MIDYKYQAGWDQQLAKELQAGMSSEVQLQANGAEHTNSVAPVSIIHSLLQQYAHLSVSTLTSVIWMMIEKTLNSFNADDSLHGLFALLNSTDRRVSPFIATHDYRIHVVTCESSGDVEINISPIYRLGPEFPVMYQQKYGKKLKKEAIIKLFTNNNSLVAFHPSSEQAYTLGIDAGMALESSKIAHNKKLRLNKKLHLKIGITNSGITADLNCETQTMTKTFTWEQLDTQELYCQIPETDICVAG